MASGNLYHSTVGFYFLLFTEESDGEDVKEKKYRVTIFTCRKRYYGFTDEFCRMVGTSRRASSGTT